MGDISYMMIMLVVAGGIVVAVVLGMLVVRRSPPPLSVSLPAIQYAAKSSVQADFIQQSISRSPILVPLICEALAVLNMSTGSALDGVFGEIL